jgi:hypothetical protein
MLFYVIVLGATSFAGDLQKMFVYYLAINIWFIIFIVIMFSNHGCSEGGAGGHLPTPAPQTELYLIIPNV